VKITEVHQQNGGFLKWWYPTTMGSPTRNDRFGVFWGYHHFRKPANISKNKTLAPVWQSTTPGV